MTEEAQGDATEQDERARVRAPEMSWALREVNRAAADAEQALARRLGMRPMDYAALGHVMTAREPLGPAELSSRLGISTGSATELADRLARAGHLERHAHPMDRRRVALRATEPAIGRVLGALAPLFDDVDALTADFTAAEQEVVVRYLRAAAQRLRSYADGPDS